MLGEHRRLFACETDAVAPRRNLEPVVGGRLERHQGPPSIKRGGFVIEKFKSGTLSVDGKPKLDDSKAAGGF